MKYKEEKRSNPVRIFYFLKPDMYGNLLLQDTINETPKAKSYILEEQLGDEDIPISLLTRHGGETYGNKSRNSMRIQWMNNPDRLHNLGAVVIKLLGYDMTTNPTVAEILRNTKARHDMEMRQLITGGMNYINSSDSASVLGDYYMRKRKSLRLKTKRKVVKKCRCKNER